MQILVVSGFLGAGKTTFIKELARRTRKTIAILENEYGNENIDGSRIADSVNDRSDRSVNIFELSEGCICCSTKKDLGLSVVTVANTIDPDILVIEPTGLAILSNIILNLKKVAYSHISILDPITIVDFGSFRRFSKEYGDIYLDQIKAAGSIIITKAGNANANEKYDLQSSIYKINPNASICLDDYYNMPDPWWDGLIENERGFEEILEEQLASDNIEHISLTNVILPSENHLLHLLENICRGRHGSIIRGKGKIKAGGQMLQFDYVDRTYSVTGIDCNEASSLVFIGRNIDRPSIEKLFDKEPARTMSIIRKLPGQSFLMR